MLNLDDSCCSINRGHISPLAGCTVKCALPHCPISCGFQVLCLYRFTSRDLPAPDRVCLISQTESGIYTLLHQEEQQDNCSCFINIKPVELSLIDKQTNTSELFGAALLNSGIQNLEIKAAIDCLTRIPSNFCQTGGVPHTFCIMLLLNFESSKITS